MPDLPKTYAAVREYIRTMIFNPAERFLEDVDYQQAIKWGASQFATMIGGIYTKELITTTANTEIYTLTDGLMKIRRARYVTDVGLSTEEKSVIEVINEDDLAYIESISIRDVLPADERALTITGSPQDKPKYLVYDTDTNEVRLFDATKNAGDQIELWIVTSGLEFSPGGAWDGEAIEVPGIAYMACIALREKSRDIGEAEYFEARAEKAAARVIKMRQKSRQVKQIQDEQTRIRRTRSLFGAK